MQYPGQASRIAVVMLALTALAACSRDAQVPGPPLKSVVEHEYAFAAHSVAHGMRAAFIEYLAPDGVLFRPTPVSAQTWLREQPETPGTLSWYPEMAGVSGDGTMGYSSGPYRYERAAGGDPGFGHFLSI